MGGGSGYAYAPWIVSPLEAIQGRARQEGAEVRILSPSFRPHLYDPHVMQRHATQIGWVLNDTDYDSVTSLVSTSDLTFVFVNAYSTEGRDRPNITLDHSGDALIASAVNYSSNVVVVMHIPGVVDVEKWIENENVTAVVAAWLPGGGERGGVGAGVVGGMWRRVGNCRLRGGRI